MTKAWAVVLALAVALSVAACGGSDDSGADSAAPAATTAAAEPATSAAATDAAASSVAPASSEAAPSSAAAEPVDITVGVLAPQTGFAANYGPETQAGIDLALAEIGAAGDVNVKIVTADEDVLDASQTLERLKKMVESDGAQIVVGPIFGSTQQAVAPYLKDKGIPWFSMLGASKEVAGSGGTAFVWPGADELTAGPLGDYAAKDLGYKRIATLAP